MHKTKVLRKMLRGPTGASVKLPHHGQFFMLVQLMLKEQYHCRKTIPGKVEGNSSSNSILNCLSGPYNEESFSAKCKNFFI